MNPRQAMWVVAVAVMLAWSPTVAQDAPNPLKNVYFGEQHLHTVNSPDAFSFGTRNTPDDAYEFCKGNPINKSTTGEMIQKATPYDWCAVTDHSEYLGMMPLLLDPNSVLKDTPFVMLTLGVASILAADLAEDLLAGEMTLRGATPFVVAYVLISTLFIVGPLFSFTALLIRTKRRGVVEYGDLGDELFREFDEKWLPQSGRAQRELLGNSDPSSLADFGYAYEVVSAMRSVPFDRSSLLVVIGITLAPFVPLLLVNYSVSEILQRLIGVVG